MNAAPAPDHVDPSERHGPFDPDDHVARVFSQLPKSTRKWLTELREEDIDEIEQARDFLRYAAAAGWVVKWSLIALFAVFAGFSSILQVWNGIKSGFK